ncbi:uncharacterized protein LOC133806516 [Humulus lupulus]|uniref:uncharacterized protein LOC133806516 n=1 Tax=Humulus lupulus TaxID=3486 RepID=UPI002B40D126|nr:uncharacterized protein LOC133806516 [Humulus lupulus]
MESHHIISWNVRGINKREKQKALSQFCLVNKVGFGALLETKLRGDKIEKMMSMFFSSWEFYTGTVAEGRILLVWQRQYVSVEVRMESDQLVHVLATEVRTNKKFYVTFVYGRNTIEERRQLWNDLAGLFVPNTPWLVAGDFNAVFEVTDRVGGRGITAMELEDAQNWRALGWVDEIRTNGSHFTWTNKQANEDIIYSKLDRVFINEEWGDVFPNSVVVVNWDLLSDHCYCIIKSEVVVNQGIRLFRFFNLWTDHDRYSEVVLQNWRKSCKGEGLGKIIQKLSRLQQVLWQFNKCTVGDVGQNYTSAKEKFQEANLILQRNPHSTELQNNERIAGELFAKHAKTYDSFLRQKSKVNWLRHGDDNTAYFHACLK